MVAALPELHHGVHEIRHIGSSAPFGKVVEVLLEDGTVILLLDVGELYLHNSFFFGGKRLLHILFQTP